MSAQPAMRRRSGGGATASKRATPQPVQKRAPGALRVRQRGHSTPDPISAAQRAKDLGGGLGGSDAHGAQPRAVAPDEKGGVPVTLRAGRRLDGRGSPPSPVERRVERRCDDCNGALLHNSTMSTDWDGLPCGYCERHRRCRHDPRSSGRRGGQPPVARCASHPGDDDRSRHHGAERPVWSRRPYRVWHAWQAERMSPRSGRLTPTPEAERAGGRLRV
jgi:hypothetical protein